MKKIFLTLFAFILFIPHFIFAATISNENQQQVDDFTSSWASIFSTTMWIKLILAILSVLFTLIISKLVRLKLLDYLERKSEWEAGREEMIWVVTRSVNIAILLLWTSVTLSVLGIDLWILLWGLWFWLGFTLKSFLSNFISWIMMVTQWYYHIWDLVDIWWQKWTIVKINSLFTELKDFDGIVFYVPNINFMEKEVANYHTNDKRRIEINVWVDYETDLVKAKNLLEQVVLSFPNVLRWPEPKIFVKDFNSSSIDLRILFWISTKWWDYFETRSNVTETINHAFRKAWITIPFPQVTISNRADTIKY